MSDQPIVYEGQVWQRPGEWIRKNDRAVLRFPAFATRKVYWPAVIVVPLIAAVLVIFAIDSPYSKSFLMIFVIGVSTLVWIFAVWSLRGMRELQISFGPTSLTYMFGDSRPVELTYSQINVLLFVHDGASSRISIETVQRHFTWGTLGNVSGPSRRRLLNSASMWRHIPEVPLEVNERLEAAGLIGIHSLYGGVASTEYTRVPRGGYTNRIDNPVMYTKEAQQQQRQRWWLLGLVAVLIAVSAAISYITFFLV